MKLRISAVILAAGRGERMGKSRNKPYLLIDDKPVLMYSVEKFDKHPSISEIITVINRNDDQLYQGVIERYSSQKKIIKVYGGAKRQDSSYAGVKSSTSQSDLVMVHDGARPFFSLELIDKLIEAAKMHRGTVPGIPVIDTLRKRDKSGRAGETLSRDNLYRMQTPQCFERSLLIGCLEQAKSEGRYFTDEAGLVKEMGGVDSFLIPGERENIKITSPYDLKIARCITNSQG